MSAPASDVPAAAAAAPAADATLTSKDYYFDSYAHFGKFYKKKKKKKVFDLTLFFVH